MITGEYIGGFRVVRTLGVGSRSEVYLGHGGDERVAAIKVFGPGVELTSIDTEIEALARADHAHSLQLRDVASAPGGLPCLILERLGHGTLAHLLAGRSALSPGEAVTVLAPLVAAIGALHSSGVAHGAISASAVMFRETGAPVLASFGHATVLAPGGSAVLLAASRAIHDDRVAVARLAATVLARVVSASATELSRWLLQIERDGSPDGFLDELELRVFGLGVASPVRFVRDADNIALSALPQRVHTADPVAAVAVQEPPALLSLAGVRAIVLSRLPQLATRRPVWVAAGVGVAVLATALLLLPDGGDKSAATAPEPVETAARTSAVGGDDPVVALGELLAGRAQCIRDLSILCLENAVQSGSAAMDDDVALIHAIEDGSTTGSVADQPSAMTLVERHGDAALVSYQTAVNGEPASVLLVKGEAGWRIRDYVPGA